jgi:hypothetical protein
MRASIDVLQLDIAPPITDLFTILPPGYYSSGTYTIPGGRTWADFSLLIPDGGMYSDDTRGGGQIYPPELFLSGGWAYSLRGRRGYEADSFKRSAVTYVSATSFTITVTGTGRIYGLYGVLK